ncbi:MAG: hypothetical protein KME42_15640 [Tildeniella nuda ZEHNDER 1965/U140]|nr:hypothetical protein [Tildeniella nuda ZEHNDER 1965/U140]
MDKSSSSPKSFPSVQTIVLAEIVLAVLALLFFLLFSVPLPGQDRPLWYSIGTTAFEEIAYFVAAWLCFRNWRSPQIVSGRNVWLCIGLGLLFYFLGGLLFFYWETILGQEADVSPGDFFYILTYIFLIVGIVLAVASRRLNLELWQWGVVTVIAAISIVIAWFVSSPVSGSMPQALLMQPVAAQTAPATKPTAKPTAKPGVLKASPKSAPAVKAKPAVPVASPSAPAVIAPVPTAGEKKAPAEAVPGNQTVPVPAAEQKAPPPEWVLALEETLKPLKPYVNGYYIVCDVLLLIIATTLLLAFWGGRFAQSWRMIAAAAFSLYIADIWFKYTTTHLANYQSGGFLEVFWVFSGVLFGIGAALEHDLSSRARSRTGGRRRASS